MDRRCTISSQRSPLAGLAALQALPPLPKSKTTRPYLASRVIKISESGGNCSIAEPMRAGGLISRQRSRRSTCTAGLQALKALPGSPPNIFRLLENLNSDCVLLSCAIMSRSASIEKIRLIVTQSEKDVRAATQAMSPIGDGSFDSNRAEFGFKSLEELPAIVVAARHAQSTVDFGALAVSLTPLASALFMYSQELTGPAGCAAIAAACRDSDCAEALSEVVSEFSTAFDPWFEVLESLRLKDAKEGEIPEGLVPKLYSPVPLAVAPFPLVLEALNGGPQNGASSSIENLILCKAAMQNFLKLAVGSTKIIVDSYNLHSCYQAELSDLRDGLFTNNDIHCKLLPWVNDAVLLLTAASAALEARNVVYDPPSGPSLAYWCSIYMMFIRYYIFDMPEAGEGPPRTAEIQRQPERLSRLLAMPNFANAFIAAQEKCCVLSDGSERMVNLTRSALIYGSKSAYAVALIIINEDVLEPQTAVPPEWQENVNVILAPDTWDKLLASSVAFRETAVALGDTLEASDRARALGAAIMTALLAMYASGSELCSRPRTERLDADFVVAALGSLAIAWNTDAAIFEPGISPSEGFVCYMCDCIKYALERFNVVQVQVGSSSSNNSTAAQMARVLNAVSVVEGLSCMAGSMFATLKTHVEEQHTGSEDCSFEVAIDILNAVKSISYTTVLMYERLLVDLDVKDHGFAAMAALQAVHATLAAARAFATLDWSLSTHHISQDTLNSLPNLLILSTVQLSHMLTAVVERQPGVTVTLDDASLAGLALNIFATMDVITRSNSEAFSDAQNRVLADFISYRVDLPYVFQQLVWMVATIDSKVGLSEYINCPEPGAGALFAVAMRWRGNGADSLHASQALVVAQLAGTTQGNAVSEESRKRRLRALATLPCACPGCCRVRRPGESTLPSKRCSGCLVSRYCSAECQREAWKDHKPGCRLIAAERDSSGGGA